MDIFYEESSLSQSSKKESRRYKIIHYVSYLFVFLTAIFGIFAIMWTPASICIFFWLNTAFFFGMWYLLYRLKSRLNLSYDYTFVTGELRISRVINVNRRKLQTRFDCENIIQIGDMDSESYEQLASDPTAKKVYYTSNVEPSEGKFFMYILIEDGGKKLYVLECRETLLMHIMRFAKRTSLAHDYVTQEKKQKQ